MEQKKKTQDGVEHLTTLIGSKPSLFLHTAIFGLFFLCALLEVISWNLMLLILTTLVSLEAIYLAIFIQMTVNRHAESLQEVEADIDEIEEGLDEIQEDEERDQERRKTQLEAIATLTADVRKVLADLEHLKRGK